MFMKTNIWWNVLRRTQKPFCPFPVPICTLWKKRIFQWSFVLLQHRSVFFGRKTKRSEDECNKNKREQPRFGVAKPVKTVQIQKRWYHRCHEIGSKMIRVFVYLDWESFWNDVWFDCSNKSESDTYVIIFSASYVNQIPDQNAGHNDFELCAQKLWLYLNNKTIIIKQKQRFPFRRWPNCLPLRIFVYSYQTMFVERRFTIAVR